MGSGVPRTPSRLRLRAHLPPSPPESCSRSSPQSRAGEQRPPRRQEAAPAPPRPAAARPPGRRSRRVCVRTLPASDPGPGGGRRTAAPRGQSRALPKTLLHLRPETSLRPPQHPFPNRSHPLLSFSALPLTTPPPGSLPYSAILPHPRSQFPPSFHAVLSCHLE